MKKNSLKAFGLLLSLAMVSALSACGQSNSGNSGSKPPLDNSDEPSSSMSSSSMPSESPSDSDVIPSSDSDNTSDSTPTEQAVSKIAVKSNPTQTEYWVGDTLSVEGGVITVTYKDKTTKDVPMTDSAVTIGAVNMNVAAVSKAVKVTYRGKSAQFYIKVKESGGTVTFDFNYEGSTPISEKYEAKKEIAEPEAPQRQNYTFYKWFADRDCTVEYDFGKINSGDLTLYACWKDNSKTYFDFVYDLNYYGLAIQTYTQIVASGDPSRALGFTPVRDEFAFDGWFLNAECTNAYSTSAVSANTTVYAKWNKTKQGSSSYKFEGEQCDMDDQEGPGMSGSAGGGAMMVSAKNEGVSGKVVSYLYKEGLHVDFCFASSEDATATLHVYLCAEFNIKLNSSMYKMKLYNSANPSGLELEYDAVDLIDGAPVTCITIPNVALKKGANVVSLITANSANPTGVEGSGTYKGTAPMIDRIEIETEAVLIWDGAKGLPKNY